MRAIFVRLIEAIGTSLVTLVILVTACFAGPDQQTASGDGALHKRDCIDRTHGRNCITSLGPTHFAGRVRALVVRPDDPNTIWAATPGGGLWVTHDGGASWGHASDVLRTLAFSSLAIDPSNPNVMYAGSGEIHRALPNINPIGASYGFIVDSARRGAGIFKTTDGGTTWNELTNTTLSRDFYFVSRIAISPLNPQIVLAATATGLWRSADGGLTWALAANSLTGQPLTGVFLDVRFHPDDPADAVATSLGARVFFSIDKVGHGWAASALPSAVAQGSGTATRVELAPSPGDPGVWVAAHILSNGDTSPMTILRSKDRGASFALQVAPAGVGCVNNRLHSGALIVPKQPVVREDVIVAGSGIGPGGPTPGLCVVHMIDGNFTPQFVDMVHADIHSLVDGGVNSAGEPTLLVGGDGGVVRVFGTETGGQVVNLNNGLVNQQFFGAAINNSGIVVGGAQDIGSMRRGTDGVWTPFSCCDGPGGSDGTTTAGDPAESDLFYFGNSQARLFRSDLFGPHSILGTAPHNLTDAHSHNCLNATPILLDPKDPNTLFVGCARLWRTANVKSLISEQISWSVIKPADTSTSDTILIGAMALAPWSRTVMWVGTLNATHPDKPGQLWMTTNLPNCSAAANCFQQIADPALPSRPVSGVALHPTDQNRVYASFSGWPSNDFATPSHNLFRGIKGADGKFHFADISAGLPPGPVYGVAVGPSGKIAAATEFGVRISTNDGTTWSLLGPRAPVANATWLDARMILVASFGRGVFRATAP